MSLGIVALIAFVALAVALDRAAHHVSPEAEEEAVRSLARGLWAILRFAFWLARKAVWFAFGRLLPALARTVGGFARWMFAPGPGRVERLIGGAFVVVFVVPLALYTIAMTVRDLARALGDGVGTGVASLEVSIEARLPGHPGLPRQSAPAQQGANPHAQPGPSASTPLDALHALVGLPPQVWMPLALLCAIAIGLVAARVIQTQRTLASRETWVVRPQSGWAADGASSLEPALERLLSGVQGARRRVGAWLDRPASAVVITYTVTGAPRDPVSVQTPLGTPVTLISFPARNRGAVLKAFGGLPELELTALEEFECEALPPLQGRRHTQRLELRPASEWRALQRPGYPVADSLAELLSELNVPRGDRMEIQVVIQPQSPAQQQRWRKLRQEWPIRRELWREIRQTARDEELKVARRRARKAIRREWKARADQEGKGRTERLFGVSVRVRASVGCTEPGWGRFVPGRTCCLEHERVNGFMHRTESAFEAFNGGHNHLRSRGLTIPGVVHLGMNVPGRRHLFDWRLDREVA